MFESQPQQSRAWRVFAIAAVAIATPLILRAGSVTEWMRSATGAVALVGLVGYAFGFRVGPSLFWRFFSVLFTVAITVRLGQQAAPALSGLPANQLSSGHRPAAIALGFVFFALLCLALFRHSGLIPAPARAYPRKSEPLFPSRAGQWQRATMAMAEARAQVERPMSVAEQAEARSFGRWRQLTLKQHQRVTTSLLLATLLFQTAAAGRHSVQAPVFMAALLLGVAAAITTYHSAEFMLKNRSLLAKSLKPLVALLALTAASFLLPSSSSLKLWLARTCLLDISSLLFGNLLITTFQVLRRHH